MADRLISLGSLADYQNTLYKSFVQYNSSNSIKILAGTYNIGGYFRKIDQDRIINPTLEPNKYYSIYLTIRNNNPQIANIEILEEPNLPSSANLIAYSKIGGFSTDSNRNIIFSSVYGKNIDDIEKIIQYTIGGTKIYSYQPSQASNWINFITNTTSTNRIYWRTLRKVEDNYSPILFTIPEAKRYLMELSIEISMRVSSGYAYDVYLFFCFTSEDINNVIYTLSDTAPSSCNGNFYLLTSSGYSAANQSYFGGFFYIKDIVNFTNTNLYATFGILNSSSNLTYQVAYKNFKSGTINLRLVDLS